MKKRKGGTNEVGEGAFACWLFMYWSIGYSASARSICFVDYNRDKSNGLPLEAFTKRVKINMVG